MFYSYGVGTGTAWSQVEKLSNKELELSLKDNDFFNTLAQELSLKYANFGPLFVPAPAYVPVR
jgi:hypothetical protein